MKTHRPMFVCLLMALSVIAHAQDGATPAPAAAPAETEMQKWIAATDAQWQAVCKRDVSDVHLTELEKLKQQYVASLEAAVTKASGAGDLDGAVALRNEEKRFAGTNLFPEQNDAADAASVKQIRAAIRAQIARLDKDTAARTKALHAKYDQVLAQAQTQLTQRQRIDDALLVKAKRAEIAASWITPAIAAAAENPGPATIPAVAGQRPGPPRTNGVSAEFVEHISALTNGKTGIPLLLKKNDMITTKAAFKPPVEILVEAKTNSTNLRLSYAADQIIFNWEMARNELRIDGGPANKMHQKTGGLIPTNKYVLVRWVVTPNRQSIYVDGELRFEHRGDYSGIDKPVSVFSAKGSEVAVKSIKVKQLPPGTE